ncbi:hypothetical protein KXQ82_09470 [Mucilaginibacter sp. HMF5004]|uniref:hypothetical protein n=1 Tax=Mucilaginibacter rivuli TaxID=2857527 RepID=UPI001C5D83EB|nr:hypothetical protein [Mucilaginibacter rivuli]MBW4889945.1 hypothetical protein [Mucilaginibacter rivuli]
MKENIRFHLNDPKQLEKMYRAGKVPFKQAFAELYPEVSGTPIADFWHERLSFENEEINRGTSRDMILLVIAALLAGFIAKIPAIFSISEDFFYPRNIGFVIFPLLTTYFAWKNKLSNSKIAFVAGATVTGLLFINLLPDAKNSDSLILSCIHLALFLWSVLGFAFVGETGNNQEKRLGYLKYNGDLAVITALILIAGGIMSAITVGLFSIIGLHIEKFYFQNIAIIGLAAAPIVGTYLTQTNPQLVGKVSPVIAKLFSPLVAVMLVVYLTAMIFSNKNPYNDREFLIIFNALLIGVMAIIFFSVAETTKDIKSNLQIWVLFILAILTIIVNGVALSAILFRISEWGLTPNRVTVLGGNVLILINLLLVSVQLFKTLNRKTELAAVGKVTSSYLPVYMIWAAIITFILPFVFGFK